MEHWANIFSKKAPQNMFKTRLGTFENDFAYFCNFEKFLFFLNFFEDWALNTTQKFFSKTWGKFGILKTFWFFLNLI